MTILADMRVALTRAKAPVGWSIGPGAWHALMADLAYDENAGAADRTTNPTLILALPFKRVTAFEGWELMTVGVDAKPGPRRRK